MSNYCNCPNCRTENCPAGTEEARLKTENARLAAALSQLVAACDDCLPMTGERPIDVTYYASKLAQILGAAEQAKDIDSTALRDLLGPIKEDATTIATLCQTTGMSFECQSFRATELAQKILTRLRALMGEKV